MSRTAVSGVKYRDDIMEQQIKRFRFTKESAISDIATSLDHISISMKSISKSYNNILRVNAAVLTYLWNKEIHEKARNETEEDIEHSSIREKQ
ncbi:hypothetical protein P5V15_002381 [Pogonomyrmex californicus]